MWTSEDTQTSTKLKVTKGPPQTPSTAAEPPAEQVLHRPVSPTPVVLDLNIAPAVLALYGAVRLKPASEKDMSIVPQELSDLFASKAPQLIVTTSHSRQVLAGAVPPAGVPANGVPALAPDGSPQQRRVPADASGSPQLAHSSKTDVGRDSKRTSPIQFFHVNHMDKFLRCYIGVTITPTALNEVAHFCFATDPDVVYRYQLLSMRLLSSELEGRGSAKIGKHNHDDPPLLDQLRRNLPKVNGSPPRVRVTSPHFRFVAVDKGEKDQYYSGQVQITNEGKEPVSLNILQRKSFSQGADTSLGFYDFQVLLDKSLLGRGESATLLLSLILKPTAVFTTISEILVFSVDNVVRVVTTFHLLNPNGGTFGVPLSCLEWIPHSGCLGHFTVPAVLAALGSAFDVCGGHTAKDLFLLGEGENTTAKRHAVLQAASRMQSLIEDREFAELASMGPRELLALVLCWLADVPHALLTHESLAFPHFHTALNALDPSAQSIVLWVVDFCCKLAMAHRANGAHPRVLAVMFGNVLFRGRATTGAAVPHTAGVPNVLKDDIVTARNVCQHLHAWILWLLPLYARKAS